MYVIEQTVMNDFEEGLLRTLFEATYFAAMHTLSQVSHDLESTKKTPLLTIEIQQEFLTSFQAEDILYH